MRINLSPQVVAYLQSLAPSPRRALRLAIRDLPDGKGDIRFLSGRLATYQRLRVGHHRVIFKRAPKQIDCLFVERRDVVYQIFEQIRKREFLD
jgi:mRNA-degrading endonuclease RelE of RelBE toxin-antitoxin system